MTMKNTDIEKLFKGEGGYVFVSHSHLDIPTVRTVRNFLEEKGLEPILFYLRSLDGLEGKNDTFLKELIYNEIDARELFLYLDSKNARNSKWVREEYEYVKSNSPDKICVVDIEGDTEEILRKIDAVARRLRVFLSYARCDKELALRIKDELIKHDFRVYTDEDMRPDSSFHETTLEYISESNTVLMLLTEKSVQSKALFDELAYAYQMKKNIIPIIAGNVDLSTEQLFIIQNLMHCRVENDLNQNDVNKLINIIKH